MAADTDLPQETYTAGQKPLHLLCDECLDQLARFRQLLTSPSPSCEEILRRAAAGNVAALETLLTISVPLLAKNWRYRRYHADDEDLVQMALIRITGKFRNAESPYQARSFAEYRSYINMVMQSVVSNAARQHDSADSLDMLKDKHRVEPSQPGTERQIELRLMLERCEELLRTSLEREIFRRRIVFRDSVEEIVEALQHQYPDIKTKDVYRLAERAIRYLSQLPEIRAMWESDWGNQ